MIEGDKRRGGGGGDGARVVGGVLSLPVQASADEAVGQLPCLWLQRECASGGVN